ncbi:MAG: peptide-methionine (R)-S-oxide reductase MsrB [Pseudomonadales bacterium]
MVRRKLLSVLGAGPLLTLLPGLSRATNAGDGDAADAAATGFEPLKRSKTEWRQILPADRYRVLFDEDTERPHSSPLDKQYDPGTYVCAACYLPLFESEHKYDSGTGWPSFTQPIAGHMGTKTDYKLIWPRTEYHCARCGGHQGHVFNDGPKPRGERWCNNGLALIFVPQGEPLPALRT